MQDLIKKTQYFINWKNFQKEDIKDLQEVIRFHNHLYYNDEAPIISDKEYDELFRMLGNLEEKYNVFDPTSPTKRIDVLVGQQFTKWLHKSPMISLDNTYNEEDLRDFEQRIRNILKDDKKSLPYMVELKFDGLGVSLTYSNGKLVKALTRGNWIEWEDVTVNVLQITSIPHTIPFLEEVEIRWEVVLPNSQFDRINREKLEKWEKPFANPRNAASWSLRLLDYTVTKDRNLQFFAYNFPYFEKQENRNNYISFKSWKKIETYKQYIEELEFFGFLVSPFFKYVNTVEELVNLIITETKDKPVFDFDIDGLVIKLDDLSLWNTLWTTEHHPRYAIAYKFPAINVRTRILDVEHSVWRTGIVTPIAHLEPVNVGWVMVSRATLHNYEEMEVKEVMIWDEVFIVRAGEVIPEIIAVIKEYRDWIQIRIDIPETCPSCETKLQKDEWKVAWYCPNKIHCPAQVLGWLENFVSKQALNIDGLGSSIVALFLEKWFITNEISIFHLEDYKDEILSLEWFKQKSVSNLLTAIESARNQKLAQVLVALGIPQVGKKTAKVLSNYVFSKFEQHTENFKNESIYKILTSLTSEELEQIKDIWPISAKSIIYFIEEKSEFIRDLFAELNIEIEWKKTSSWKLNWAKFCITWSFDSYSRDEIVKIIEENGWEFISSVSKNLDYLIAWESAWSKLEKARGLWVWILNLEEFFEKVK